jgi:hypothetical protein
MPLAILMIPTMSSKKLWELNKASATNFGYLTQENAPS